MRQFILSHNFINQNMVQISIYLRFKIFVFFLNLQPQHMEVSRLGVELELQPPAYTTATAKQDPSHICDLYHSSQQCWILNPQSKARDRTCNLMVPSRIRFLWATTGTLSLICNLYHSTQQCQILNPQSKARDRTRNLMVPSRIRYC